MNKLLVIALFFVTATIITFFKGFVMVVLWNWFVVPVLGVPELTLVPALGFITISYLVVYQFNEKDINMNESLKEKIEKNIKKLFIGITQPVAAVFFGWLVHLFM